MRLGFLSDRRPGYWLSEAEHLGVWWCESGWKIGRERGPPEPPRDGRAKPVSVSAARGEYEPAQVILRPGKDGELLSATVSPLRDPRGATTAIDVRLDEVAYVRVTQPTDESCGRGWYPDALPPLRTPLALRAGQNQPLWLPFHVSGSTPAGDYRGELELKTTLGTSRVPLSLHVYDFALPEQTHLDLSQVERHLRERGWLDKAFTYWFDEPDPKDYEFVVAGMKRIKAAAPGVRRMLTEQPEKALLGHVEIWCGLTPEWTPARRSTRCAGKIFAAEWRTTNTSGSCNRRSNAVGRSGARVIC